MAELRLRGDEVQIRILENSVLIQTLTAIRNLTWTPKQDILRERLVGEHTDRRSDFHRGHALEMEFEPESKEHFALVKHIIDRSSRRTAASSVKIDITFICQMPNLERPRVTVYDLQFGDIPFNVVGDAFTTMKFSAEASEAQISGV